MLCLSYDQNVVIIAYELGVDVKLHSEGFASTESAFNIVHLWISDKNSIKATAT